MCKQVVPIPLVTHALLILLWPNIKSAWIVFQMYCLGFTHSAINSVHFKVPGDAKFNWIDWSSNFFLIFKVGSGNWIHQSSAMEIEMTCVWWRYHTLDCRIQWSYSSTNPFTHFLVNIIVRLPFTAFSTMLEKLPMPLISLCTYYCTNLILFIPPTLPWTYILLLTYTLGVICTGN